MGLWRPTGSTRALRWLAGLGGAVVAALSTLSIENAALAFPQLGLRPADLVLGGPADSLLSALHYNPAALRLATGSNFLVMAGARGVYGGYQRSTQLPPGFAPNQTSAEPAAPLEIRGVVPDMLIGASWDLRSDAVTLGLGLYTPYVEATSFGNGTPLANQQGRLQTLSSRYHAVESRSYGLWGTVAVGLKLRSWMQIGGGFNFGYMRTRLSLLRDLGPNPGSGSGDGLGCASPMGCERWQDRMELEYNLRGIGYGFSVGILAIPIPERLWLSASYVSPLFTQSGDEVSLEGRPALALFEPGAGPECAERLDGIRISRSDNPPACGAGRLVYSYPHLLYLGSRVRLTRGRIGSLGAGGGAGLSRGERQAREREAREREAREREKSRAENGNPSATSGTGAAVGPGPTTPVAAATSSSGGAAIELSLWSRLTIPARENLPLYIDRQIYPQGLITFPLSQRTAVAVALGLRQIWPRLTLGQELLYESPRSDPQAASPANLEGHKLDGSFAARIGLRRKLWLLLTVGVTGVFFESGAGSRFSPDRLGECRAALYDINSPACHDVRDGWAAPSAEGSYWLVAPHGAAGFEIGL